MTGWLSTEIQSGETVLLRDASITTFFQTIRFNPPGFPFRFIWKWPVSLLITNPDGKETVIPIQDVTRQIILGILGCSLMFWLITRLQKRR